MCGSDEFNCGDGMCIHISLVCNGLAECFDAADENQECGKSNSLL